MSKKHANSLIHESSPYLLQHAHNPVAWEAWGDQALERASTENKLLLVSIGYAACHWCHVMEKECFEDEEVAAAMNRDFIPIKVDREERPDIDQIYMDALQLMTGGGGWPLNVVALPDGRPFWGATYVRKPQWIQVLSQLAELYASQPEKVEGYADNLAEGLQEINRILPGDTSTGITREELGSMLSQWSGQFDPSYGGYRRAPKFMMPVHLNFFLHYASLNRDNALMRHLNTTLTKMAYGGIYDAVAGGFSRYSTDMKWHVPHFEKMLYDNAQLISLYARAYAATGEPLYREVATASVAFVREELKGPGPGFFSSLDADSPNAEGIPEEGAYYTWRKNQLERLLGDRFAAFAEFYNVNSYGLWEDGKYILIRNATEEEVARNHGLSPAELRELLASCRQILATERRKRQRPGLDNKVLASWNGLMLSALTDAHRYLGATDCLDLALENARFLRENFMEADGRMYHNQPSEKQQIPGFLEDYAAVAEAFLRLYELSFDEAWLEEARKLVDFCMEQHYDPDSRLFFFTAADQPKTVRRTLETADNVIPSSNAIMAGNLFKLSRYFPGAGYGETGKQMLASMQENIRNHPQSHAQWLQVLLYHLHPFHELAFTGPDYRKLAGTVSRNYLPQAVLAGSGGASELALLRQRTVAGKSLVYVCREGSCQLPAEDAEEALRQLMAG